MVRYETLVLTVPEITGDEAKQIEKELVQLVEKAKGELISFDRWGKYRLAYAVKKNEYGVYFLARFETENACALPKEVANMCKVKFSTVVMRDMTSRLADDESLEYQKPPSLEDAPTRDVRTFLRENKMEGLISTVDAPRKAAEPVTEVVVDTSQKAEGQKPQEASEVTEKSGEE